MRDLNGKMLEKITLASSTIHLFLTILTAGNAFPYSTSNRWSLVPSRSTFDVRTRPLAPSPLSAPARRFETTPPVPPSPSIVRIPLRVATELFLNNNNNNDGDGKRGLWDGIVSLWDEIIEVSTYGPSERRALKARRERERRSLVKEDEDDDDDESWTRAFAAAASKATTKRRDDDDDEFDGYALRDLLVAKWGVPLDVDFTRGKSNVYCTVLPAVGYGNDPSRSRHDTELEYLVHLQGVVEILRQYDRLKSFVDFVETTNKSPKRGTESVPFRLDLSEEDLDRILSRSTTR